MASVFTNCILKLAGRGNPPVGPPPPDCCGGFGGGNDDDDDGGDVTYPGECPYKVCLQAGAGCVTVPVSRDEIINQCPGLINPAEYTDPDACPYLTTNVGACDTGGNPSTDAGANCVAAIVGLQGQQMFSDDNACESCCGNLDCEGWDCNWPNQSCGGHSCDLEPIPYDIPKCGAVQSNCYRDCNEFWTQNGPQEAGGLWRSNALCKNQGGPGGGRCCNDPTIGEPPGPDQKLCPMYVCQIPGFPCFLAQYTIDQLVAVGWGDPENCPSNSGGGQEIAPGVWTGKANCDSDCTRPDPVQPPVTPPAITCRLYKCVGNNTCDPIVKTFAEWQVEFGLATAPKSCAEVRALASANGYFVNKIPCENNCPCDAFVCEDGTGNCIPTQFQPNNVDCPPPGLFVAQGGTIYYGSPNCNDQCEEICTGWQCNQNTNNCNEISFPLSDAQLTISDCDTLPGQFLLGNKLTFKNEALCQIFCDGTDPGVVPGDSQDLCDLFWCPGTGGNCLKQFGISLSNFPGKNSCAEIDGITYGPRTYYYSKQSCKDNEPQCGNITPITPPPVSVGGGPSTADEPCTFYRCLFLGNCEAISIPLNYLAGTGNFYECPGSNTSIKVEYQGDLAYASPTLCASKCGVDVNPGGDFTDVGGGVIAGTCPLYQCIAFGNSCSLVNLDKSLLGVNDCDTLPSVTTLGGIDYYKGKGTCNTSCQLDNSNDIIIFDDGGGDTGIDYCDYVRCSNYGSPCSQFLIALQNLGDFDSCNDAPDRVTFGGQELYKSSIASECDIDCGYYVDVTPDFDEREPPNVTQNECTFYTCAQNTGDPCVEVYINELFLRIAYGFNSCEETPNQFDYQNITVYRSPNCNDVCTPDYTVGGGLAGNDIDFDDPICAGYYCASPGLLDCQPVSRFLSQFPGYTSCNSVPNGAISTDGIEFYKQESKCKQDCAGVSISDPGGFTTGGGVTVTPSYCDLYRCVGAVCIATTKLTTDLGITQCSEIDNLGGSIVYQGALYYRNSDCNGDCITPGTDVDFGDDSSEICTVYACVNGVDCEQFNRLITSINGGAYSTCSQLPPSFQSNGATFYRQKQRCNNSTACGGGVSVDPFDQDGGLTGGPSEPTCTLYRCEAGACTPVSVTLGNLNNQGANLTSCLSPNSRKTIEYNGDKLYWSQSRCVTKCFFTGGGSIGDYDIFDDTPDVIDVGGGQVIDDTQGAIFCDVYSCASQNEPCIATQLRLSRVNQATGSNYFACPPETSNRIFTYDGSPYTFNQSRCNLICTTFYDADPGRKIPKPAGPVTGVDPGGGDNQSCEVWRCIGNGLPCFKQYLYLNSIPFESCPTIGSFNYTPPGTSEDITYFARKQKCDNECDNRTLISLGGNGTYDGKGDNASVIDAGDDGTSNVDATGFTFTGSAAKGTDYLTITSDGNVVRREYAFDDREAVFDLASSNRKYKDPEHYRFLPTDRGSLPADLFGNTVHLYIKSVHDMNNGRMAFSDLPYGSLSLLNIERSLSTNIKTLLEKAKYPDGTDIKKEILIYIRELIVTNRLDKVSSDFIVRLLQECQRDDVTPDAKRSTGHEAEAISLAVDTGKSVDPNKYPEGDQREQMRNWKLIATDVNKRLEVLRQSGEIQDVYVNQDDSIILYDKDLSAYTTYINDGDQYETSAAVFEIASDKDQALINDYDDIAKIMYKLNAPYQITMTINSAEVRLIEETYDTDNPRSDIYVLKLLPETMEDVPRKSPLVRHTQATFELLEDDQDINDWVSTKPFPYMQFYVDHEDPIFEHLEAKKEAVLEFEDFSLDVFQGYENLPIFPRKLPWHIGIVPTDRDDLMFGRSRSYQTKYNEREIVFKLNPMPSEHKTSLVNPILVREVGYGSGPRPKEQTNEQSRYSFNRGTVKEKIKPYKNTDEPLPRRELPGKKLFKILNELQEDGSQYVNRQGDTVSWATIYKSLTPFERKALLLTEFKDWDDVKSKLFLGKFATNPEVASRYPKVSEVPNLNLDDVREYVLPSITVRKLDIDPESETPEPLP